MAERSGLPLRLLELGASAGLNLRLDRFREQGGVGFGPEDSPVRFVDFIAGGMPPLAHGFEVAERSAGDLNPVDATSEEGRLTLLACVFPDETERYALLEEAIEVARATPAPVERATSRARPDGSPSHARARHGRLPHDRLALPARRRTRVAEHTIATAGRRASAEAPLALVAFEGAVDDPARIETHLTLWPGGERTLLAVCSHHPTTVDWLDKA